MDDDTGLLFDLPSVARKKVSAAFDGGRITSDGGVALLALADRRIGRPSARSRLSVPGLEGLMAGRRRSRVGTRRRRRTGSAAGQ